jgi:hypothetical protein
MEKIVSTILYYHRFGKNVVDGRPMCGRGRFLMARLILTLIKLVGVVMLVSLVDHSFGCTCYFNLVDVARYSRL